MHNKLKKVDSKFDVRRNIFSSITDNITQAYQNDSRPWIIGFSGGKDSTALLQCIYRSLLNLPRHKRTKHVYVLSSDTRVELPQIAARIKSELENITLAALKDGLPISTHVVYPKLNDTFWVNVIGRGYPSPNTRFRWCTDRLKIHPVSEFIRKTVTKLGSVTIVLGNRKAESATRSQSMKRNSLPGTKFRPHRELTKAYVYTPLEDLTTNEIWTYLLEIPNPWNMNNGELVSLYKQASGGECPLVIDRSTASCGHSRFGCWTCTVVDKDKSMEAMIFQGEKNLIPLYEIRDFLRDIRIAKGSRYDLRRNGTVPFHRINNEKMQNTGPFTHDTRQDILRKVLKAQVESGYSLIEGDELSLIQEIWDNEETSHPQRGHLHLKLVSSIVKQNFQEVTMSKETPSAIDREDILLREVCNETGIPLDLILSLREKEEEFSHLRRRHGLPEQMREVFDLYSKEGE